MCAAGVAAPWGIRQRLPLGVKAGTYAFKVKVKAPSSTIVAPATQVFAQMNVVDGSGARVDGSEATDNALQSAKGAWADYGTKRTMTEGQLLEVAVVSKAPGGCMLVDDAFLDPAP